MKQDVVATLERTGATGLGAHGNADVINVDFVRHVRDAGAEFHVWTVNHPLLARYFARLGVDSITTDRPALIRRVLSDSKAAAKADVIRQLQDDVTDVLLDRCEQVVPIQQQLLPDALFEK